MPSGIVRMFQKPMAMPARYVCSQVATRKITLKPDAMSPVQIT